MEEPDQHPLVGLFAFPVSFARPHRGTLSTKDPPLMADDQYLIERPMPPILLEPGLRLAAHGVTSDGQMWLKFINTGSGALRVVHVLVLAASFQYHYAVRDRSTGTILGYQGPHGDMSKDESFIYGDASF